LLDSYGKIFLPMVMTAVETDMNAALIQTKLVAVLQNIQALSHLECPPIVGATKPIEALPKFDSKIWPVAIGMLAAELGIIIPDDVNIFRRDKSCVALTIDETVAMVINLANAQAMPAPQVVNE
jgi:hypothetical protein